LIYERTVLGNSEYVDILEIAWKFYLLWTAILDIMRWVLPVSIPFLLLQPGLRLANPT